MATKPKRLNNKQRIMDARGKIRTEVIGKLSNFAEPGHPIPDDEGGEKTQLWEDLGLGSEARSALSIPFSKIALRHGGMAISPSEAGACKDVKGCIDLIFKKLPK